MTARPDDGVLYWIQSNSRVGVCVCVCDLCVTKRERTASVVRELKRWGRPSDVLLLLLVELLWLPFDVVVVVVAGGGDGGGAAALAASKIAVVVVADVCMKYSAMMRQFLQLNSAVVVVVVLYWLRCTKGTLRAWLHSNKSRTAENLHMR